MLTQRVSCGCTFCYELVTPATDFLVPTSMWDRFLSVLARATIMSVDNRVEVRDDIRILVAKHKGSQSKKGLSRMGSKFCPACYMWLENIPTALRTCRACNSTIKISRSFTQLEGGLGRHRTELVGRRGQRAGRVDK